MTYQVFIPLVLLQILNLFWYYLMMRILARFVSLLSILSNLFLTPIPGPSSVSKLEMSDQTMRMMAKMRTKRARKTRHILIPYPQQLESHTTRPWLAPKNNLYFSYEYTMK
jgi:hypothetical protein